MEDAENVNEILPMPKIPKTIYMCHKNLEQIKLYSQNWKNLNPEWEIELYDDDRCKEFFLNEFSQLHADIFEFIKDGPIKADFWRICVLYKYGGLYIDADIEPLVPLKDFISDDDDFCYCIINKNWYNPHFILTNKEDEFLKVLIDEYIDRYNTISYSYGEYSIVGVFNKFINLDISNSGVYNINNKIYKILTNEYENGIVNEHSKYNGVRIFNNRYSTYDHYSHSFLK
jgi:mannosyltransferase OCH1-like enzyme